MGIARQVNRVTEMFCFVGKAETEFLRWKVAKAPTLRWISNRLILRLNIRGHFGNNIYRNIFFSIIWVMDALWGNSMVVFIFTNFLKILPY